MTIGIFGIQCISENLGVSALSISIIKYILDKYKNIKKIYVFSHEQQVNIKRFNNIIGNNDVEIISVRRSYKSVKNILDIIKNIEKCNYLMDFTEGDSFSSIYGNRRYIKSLADKLLVLVKKKKLILMPQTYGPYKKSVLNIFLKYIFDNSVLIFARDEESLIDIRRFSPKEISVVTDVAFYLPHKKEYYSFLSITVGLNVSGLLWNEDYSKNNPFSLCCDYRVFCKELIKVLYDKGYDIKLVPHVITSEYNSIENDVKACEDLIKEYPFCTMIERYDNPIAVKSQVAGMDVFIGSRMHSTIAAVSAGVPAIPISYSKKFRGLFNNINYEVEVPMQKLNENEAIAKILQYLDLLDVLKDKVRNAQEIIKQKQQIFEKRLEMVLIEDSDEKSMEY